MAFIHGSEHSKDFCKPITVEALARFDPELRLYFNNRLHVFQVFRVVNRPDRWTEPRLVWVCDWNEGLKGSDNPTSLIAYLRASDTGVRGENLERIQREREEAASAERQRAEARFRDDMDHLARENKRQLIKAWEPFRTTFCR